LNSGGGWFGTLAMLTEVHGLPSPYKPLLLTFTSLKFIINYHLIIRYGLAEFQVTYSIVRFTANN